MNPNIQKELYKSESQLKEEREVIEKALKEEMSQKQIWRSFSEEPRAQLLIRMLQEECKKLETKAKDFSIGSTIDSINYKEIPKILIESRTLEKVINLINTGEYTYAN